IEPINVWAGSDEPIGRLMSNLAHTPIVIDGLEFASVEAFISWLVTDPTKVEKRERIRGYWGRRSKTCAPKHWPVKISYRDCEFEVRSHEFYKLIKKAIRIKLETHPEITNEFLKSRPRPIVHVISGEPKSPSFVSMISELRDEFSKGTIDGISDCTLARFEP
ncbi:MAG: hypothetical protein ABL921_28990, partial [Pirellula sp.]